VANQGSGALFARAPTEADLVRIARSLNEQSAEYAVIGGFAMLHYGFVRATMDIDLLVDPSTENVQRIRQALTILEDRAVLEVGPEDIGKYNVVRVADEVVIDLLAQACDATLKDVASEIEFAEVEGVPIPYLSPRGLLRTKRTLRDKDALDRLFLEELLAASR
jgi:Nucleotidyl transferase AbiEii toxin, Type IV TA system